MCVLRERVQDLHCWPLIQHSRHPGPHQPSLPTAAKSPSAQLLEQVAQLKSLSDTIEKLKVSADPALPHPKSWLWSVPWWGLSTGPAGVPLGPVLCQMPCGGGGGREGGFLPLELTVLVQTEGRFSSTKWIEQDHLYRVRGSGAASVRAEITSGYSGWGWLPRACGI